ncbi:MAG: DUF799 family lipoprotein [Gammaproteobacteria bacterium]|nr:DUF799 family lipoprotein [Gammaproteobacteria bacterium]
MSGPTFRSLAATLFLASLLAGCVTAPPYDYTEFRAHQPRSILVLPPLNESTSLEGTYSYLSTVSRPVAERGYYVFPVAVVDQFLRDNGLPTPGEMHQVPLPKVVELVGADAVLYPVLSEYGSRFQITQTVTSVRVSARLVDARTGILIWQGDGYAQSGGGGSGGLLEQVVAAAITQIINSQTDPGRDVARQANGNLFYQRNRALPFGPLHPKFGQPE